MSTEIDTPVKKVSDPLGMWYPVPVTMPRLPKAALEYFRRAGRVGGKASAAKLTPEERKVRATKASHARKTYAGKRVPA